MGVPAVRRLLSSHSNIAVANETVRFAFRWLSKLWFRDNPLPVQLAVGSTAFYVHRVYGISLYQQCARRSSQRPHSTGISALREKLAVTVRPVCRRLGTNGTITGLVSANDPGNRRSDPKLPDPSIAPAGPLTVLSSLGRSSVRGNQRRKQ